MARPGFECENFACLAHAICSILAMVTLLFLLGGLALGIFILSSRSSPSETRSVQRGESAATSSP